MSSKDRRVQARGRAARRDKTRSGVVAALASLLVGMGGCDAGSNGGPDDSATGGPPTPAEPPPSVGEVLVTVKVQDALGAPVPGAKISLLRSDGSGVSQSSYLADQDGRAEIATDSLTHGVLVSAPGMESAVYESTRHDDDRLEITVTLHPSSAPVSPTSAAMRRSSRLLDQGASVAVTDPGDRRLLAATYLQTRVGDDLSGRGPRIHLRRPRLVPDDRKSHCHTDSLSVCVRNGRLLRTA